MKALSIRPDWMELFLCGEKTVECRSWRTQYRGPVCLCSTALKIPYTIPGHALLIGDLIGIHEFNLGDIQPACMEELPKIRTYAWQFDNVRYIYPVPVKGKQGLWETTFEPQEIPDEATDSEVSAMLDAITYVPDRQ